MGTGEMLHGHTEKEPRTPGMLVVLTGPTASGKSHVRDRLLEEIPGMKHVVTSTTRPPREGEIPGVHYNFLPRETFEEKLQNGEFLEHTVYSGNYYGTPIEAIRGVATGEKLTLVMDISGAAKVQDVIAKKLEPDTAQAILSHMHLMCIGTPTINEVRERFYGRDGSHTYAQTKEFRQRIRADIQNWREFWYIFENIVINETGKFDKTIEQVLAKLGVSKG